MRSAALGAVDTGTAALRSEATQRSFEALVRDMMVQARTKVARKEWKEAREALRGA